MDIIDQLRDMDIDWNDVPKPGGSYITANVRGNIAYISIQFPIKQGQFLFTGRLGKELTTDDGYKAAQLCAINVLKQVNKHIGFDKIVGMNHADIYYQAAGEWDEGRIAADGASDLFNKVFGEAGKHTRAIFGVDRLPRNYCIGMTVTFTIS